MRRAIGYADAAGGRKGADNMNVFLAGIIQGSKVRAVIHEQDWREPIKRALAQHLPNAEIYCHYSEHPNSITYGLDDIQQTLADGIGRAGRCDLLIAYLPSASMGTAIEMYEAHRGGAAVVAITPLAANWVIRAYSDRIVPDIDAFVELAATGELAGLVAGRTQQ